VESFPELAALRDGGTVNPLMRAIEIWFRQERAARVAASSVSKLPAEPAQLANNQNELRGEFGNGFLPGRFNNGFN
jgi:hypothetical protein